MSVPLSLCLSVHVPLEEKLIVTVCEKFYYNLQNKGLGLEYLFAVSL